MAASHLFCRNGLEKSDGVGKSHPAPDFGSEIFNKRQMVAIFLIQKIVAVDPENMGVMLPADDISG